MIQGFFLRRVNRRLAEVEIDGEVYEAYISNGIDMSFFKSGAVCFLRESDNTKRKTLFDLYSIDDQGTLVCIDAKEPLSIAKKWCQEQFVNEFGEQILLYPNVKEMVLLAFGKKNHDLMVQVMGTSFVKKHQAFLPGIPSKALNNRLSALLSMKERGGDPRLLFVVCRDDADSFSANREVDPFFADLLLDVKENDIPINALRCSVDEIGMRIEKEIPVIY